MTSKLRVVYPRYYPHVSSECAEFPPLAVTRNCPFPGLMVEILNLIAKELHMKIEPIVVNDPNDTTTLDTTDMHDAFTYIRNGSADTLAMGMESTWERKFMFAFSDPLYKIQTRFIMQQTENMYNSMWSFFFIFDKRTWITILTALLMQCCLCVLIRQTEVCMNGAKPIGILESAWQMIRLQLLQPEKVYFRSKAGKLSIIFFSLIQCAVLLGVFSSWILSNILRAGHSSPVDSIERLVEKISRREYYLVTTNLNHWFYEEINQSQMFPYAELRSAIQYNYVRTTGSPEESLRQISTGRAVSFVQDDSETYFHSINYCGLVDLHADMPIAEARLIFTKNTTLLRNVNRVLHDNMMLISRIKRKYLNTLRKMERPTCSQPHTAIGLVPYLGVCAICLLFTTIACIVLFGEIASSYTNSKLNKAQPFMRHASLRSFYR